MILLTGALLASTGRAWPEIFVAGRKTSLPVELSRDMVGALGNVLCNVLCYVLCYVFCYVLCYVLC